MSKVILVFGKKQNCQKLKIFVRRDLLWPEVERKLTNDEASSRSTNNKLIQGVPKKDWL